MHTKDGEEKKNDEIQIFGSRFFPGNFGNPCCYWLGSVGGGSAVNSESSLADGRDVECRMHY